MSFRNFSKAQDTSTKKEAGIKIEDKKVAVEPGKPANLIGPTLPKDK